LRATKDIVPQVEQFEALHPDVKIETINMGSDDLQKKVMMSLMTGQGAPDVFYGVDTFTHRYYRSDLIHALDDVVPDYENIFLKALSHRWTYQGKLWAIPYDMGPFVIFYRQDIFDEVGIDFPESWQDFVEVGKKITVPGKRVMTVLRNDRANTLASMVQSRGGQITNLKNEVLFNNPIVLEVCQYMVDLVNKYKIADYATLWDSAAWVKIKEDRWVTIPAWFWYSGFGLKDLAYMPELEGKWRISRALPWKTGDPPTGAGYSGGGLWVVPKQTEYPTLTKEFVASLGTKEAQVSQATIGGIMPVNVLALEELSELQDPFFGGQRPYKIILEEMRDCPVMEFGDKYDGSIDPALNNALNAMILEGVSAQKALDDAEKDAIAELRE